MIKNAFEGLLAAGLMVTAHVAVLGVGVGAGAAPAGVVCMTAVALAALASRK